MWVNKSEYWWIQANVHLFLCIFMPAKKGKKCHVFAPNLIQELYIHQLQVFVEEKVRGGNIWPLRGTIWNENENTHLRGKKMRMANIKWTTWEGLVCLEGWGGRRPWSKSFHHQHQQFFETSWDQTNERRMGTKSQPWNWELSMEPRVFSPIIMIIITIMIIIVIIIIIIIGTQSFLPNNAQFSSASKLSLLFQLVGSFLQLSGNQKCFLAIIYNQK